MEESSAEEITSEIVELARGLNHDPKLIYEYVRNHVDYVPYFGSLKGAAMTYFDGAGNDFDQASLMIALLRESGYQAQYVYGRMLIPYYGGDDNQDMQHWLSVDGSTALILQALYNGGISADTYGSYCRMDRVWVRAVIDGNTYVFDPAFKTYKTTSGINLSDAMEYDRSSLLSAAGGTLGTDYIAGMNETSLNTLLTTYSGNLSAFIRDNYPNASMEEIIGSREIVPEYLDELPTSLGFTIYSQDTPWDEIPEEYSHTVTIRHGGINITKDIASLGGKRLSLSYQDQDTAGSATAALSTETPLPLTNADAKSSAVLIAEPSWVETGLPADSVLSPGMQVTAPDIEGGDMVSALETSSQNFGRIYPPSVGASSSSVTWNPSAPSNNTVTIQLVVSLTNNPQSAYSITAGAGTHNLAPGQGVDVTVKFSNSGQSAGTKTGQLRFQWKFSGSVIGTDYINLTGVVANAPDISLGGINFGQSILDEPRTATATLTNNGSKSLALTSNIVLSTGDTGRFQITSNYETGTLAPGAARNMGVKYKADVRGSHATGMVLAFTYDELPYTWTYSNVLAGSTHYSPDLTGSYNPPAWQTYIGNSKSGNCILKNSGSLNLSVTSLEITGTDAARFELIGNTSADTLSSGQEREIEVEYKGDSVGSHTASVRVNFSYDGRASYIDFSLSGQTLETPLAQLWLDDTLIAEETAPVTGTDLDYMFLTIDHPYPGKDGTYADQGPVKYPMKRESGNFYTIIYDFGSSHDGRLLDKRQRKMSGYRISGFSDDSRQVLTETLNVMGTSWMRDTNLNHKLLSEIAGVLSVDHHRFGVVAQEQGYYIDVKAQQSASISRTGDSDAGDALFKATNFMDSALEHGVLEQMQVNRPAVSTVKLMQLTNDDGDKIFLVNDTNYDAIEPELTGYSDDDKNGFAADVVKGTIFILPQNAQIGLQEWAGKGYISYFEDGDSKSCGMIIGGGYYGGYGGSNVPLDVIPVVAESNTSTNSDLTQDKEPNGDPVDMVTGHFMYNNTDLALSGGAGGLVFKRTYFGGNHHIDGDLGFGWAHNYNLYAEVHSNSEAGLGYRLPTDAAPIMAASVAVLDLMTGAPGVKEWATSSLIGKWGMDQLIDNAVSLHLESDLLTYIRLPDGSFAKPPGVNATLTLTSGQYRMEERFDRVIQFNTDHRAGTITDADGNTVDFTYTNGKVSSVSDSFNHTLTIGYTGDLLTSVSDSAGRSVSFGYGDDNLTSYTDPEGKVWDYGYIDDHKLETLQNPEGITTVINIHDTLGRVMTQTVPRQTGDTTYNLYYSGYRSVEEDSQGNRVISRYDRKKRLIASEDALGNTTGYTYDGQNHVVSTTDPRGNTTNYEYDGNNNLVRTVNALGEETVNTYDARFRLTDITDNLGHVTHNDYDSEHHLEKTTVWPKSGQAIETSATFYSNGLPHTSTDGRGIVTTLTYDNYGNPDTNQTASAPAVDYNYNGIGLMTGLTDQGGSATSFVYDDRGLLQTRTDPFLNAMSITYYDDGKINTITDRNNDTVTYTFTDSGKPDTVAFPSGTPTTYTYDTRDNLIQMQDSLGTTTFAYDAVNRLISKTDAGGFSVAYTFDEAGNLATLTYPGNKTVTYTYDELNRLKTVTDWMDRTATYDYDPAGRLESLTQFNGTVITYSYDNADRLTGLDNLTASGGDAIATYQFTLDGNGNRTQVTREVPLEPDLTATTRTFTISTTGNQIESDGTNTFTYDDEGQLIAAYGNTLTFDPEHRLTSIAGNTTHQFRYDGAGNRLEADRDGVVTRYIYDASGNLLAEADASNQIQRYYIYGAGLLAMVEPAGTLYCYHFDATGHTVALTDNTKTIVNAYAYTPFGTIANQQENVVQPFKFVGQYGVMAEDNGWYYMRARYYDPAMGRFISEDPLGFDGGDVNLYAYVQNNPVMSVDPLGLWQVSFGGGFGLAGYITFGNNNGRWNIGGGIGIGVGLAGSYNPANNDPNTPMANGNSQSAASLGVEAQGFIAAGRGAEIAGDLSVKLKANNDNIALSTGINGGASIPGLTGQFSATGEANLNSAGNLSSHISVQANKRASLGGFIFSGINGGYTWK
nr:RHS repeat-associated core domain-containing protein [uncultured Desulfobacter sp.]